MKDQSTSSLFFVTALATALAIATFCGCKSSSRKAVIESKVPNVWAEKPIQSVALKMEINL